MSDDLVKRLRSGLSDFDDWDAAADRIEELEDKLAKLAKAVEMLAELATDVYPHDWRAIAALAELKGETND